MNLLLGCIADDFTGATDLANNLVRAGMRVVQTIGVPSSPLPADCNAGGIARKARTSAPAAAVAQSRQAGNGWKAQLLRALYYETEPVVTGGFSEVNRAQRVAMAQAEAEYKDFILFYPTMEEAAESEAKICDIHYRQMEKADRERAIQQAVSKDRAEIDQLKATIRQLRDELEQARLTQLQHDIVL